MKPSGLRFRAERCAPCLALQLLAVGCCRVGARVSMGSKNKQANLGGICQRPRSTTLTLLAQKALGLQSTSSWEGCWGAVLHDYSGHESLPEPSAVGHCFSQDTGVDLM